MPQLSPSKVRSSDLGMRLLKIAAVYLVAGLLLGMAMAISGQFQLRSVHAHLNLLGWVSMALVGLVYCQFPVLASNALARWHFRLHNLGLPVMMLALALYHSGYETAEPVLGLSAVVTVLALLLFSCNLVINLGRKDTTAETLSDGVLQDQPQADAVRL